MFLLQRPRLLVEVGRMSISVSAGGLLAGLTANAIKTAVFVASSVAGPGAVMLRTLQQFLQGFPTWWVPESMVGSALYVGLAGGGMAATVHGKRLCRYMEKV
jgi:hypothetical protein